MNASSFLLFIQGSSSETLEKIAYNSRELNSSFVSLKNFSLITLCDTDDIDKVKHAHKVCFDTTEVAYAYNKSATHSKFYAWAIFDTMTLKP